MTCRYIYRMRETDDVSIFQRHISPRILLTWAEHDLDAFANVLSGVRSLKLVLTADMAIGTVRNKDRQSITKAKGNTTRVSRVSDLPLPAQAFPSLTVDMLPSSFCTSFHISGTEEYAAGGTIPYKLARPNRVNFVSTFTKSRRA
jgi:hypothetical protein